MKQLNIYIIEKNIKDNVVFDIWLPSNKKVYKLLTPDSNGKYNYKKIEYQYIEDELKIDFLLGYDDKHGWCLWVGKIGVCNYDDDFYIKLDTKDFAEAILIGTDKIVEFIGKVKEDKDKWIQFYNNI